MCTQEYFKIPVEKLQAVLSAAHITTIRMILVYYSRNKNTLQVIRFQCESFTAFNIYYTF